MMSSQNPPIVDGLLRRKIGDQHAVGSGSTRRGSEFLHAHLKYRIVVAEQDERNVIARNVRLTNAANEIKDSSERRAYFERTFRGALDRRAVGKRIAEWDT